MEKYDINKGFTMPRFKDGLLIILHNYTIDLILVFFYIFKLYELKFSQIDYNKYNLIRSVAFIPRAWHPLYLLERLIYNNGIQVLEVDKHIIIDVYNNKAYIKEILD